MARRAKPRILPNQTGRSSRGLHFHRRRTRPEFGSFSGKHPIHSRHRHHAHSPPQRALQRLRLYHQELLRFRGGRFILLQLLPREGVVVGSAIILARVVLHVRGRGGSSPSIGVLFVHRVPRHHVLLSRNRLDLGQCGNRPDFVIHSTFCWATVSCEGCW